jgi:hypothetical protein
MFVFRCYLFISCMVLTLGTLGNRVLAYDVSQDLDDFLSAGRLKDGEAFFEKQATIGSVKDETQVALGLIRFLQAIEYLGQSGYQHGLLNHRAQSIPMLRMPVPSNPNPKPLGYERLREIVAEFQTKLKAAEATLAEVPTESIFLKLYIGRTKLDLDGDEAFEPNETLWRIFFNLNRGLATGGLANNGSQNDDDAPDAAFQSAAEEFYVGVDGTDVHWLRGYCHFLMAVCDGALAYDERELFDRCGQLFFPNIESPFKITKDATNPALGIFDMGVLLDSVAAIHLINFKLVDVERMKSARQHLLSMIEQSRLQWERALEETDNDHEWLPNPKQTGVLNMPVRSDIIVGWKAVLDELESLLEGKKLLPLVRDNVFLSNDMRARAQPIGINVKKFFDEPSDFDLVLAMQGTGVEQYIEPGRVSDFRTWQELTRVFRGDFFGFAVWFN